MAPARLPFGVLRLLLIVPVYPARVLVVQLQALLAGRRLAVLRHRGGADPGGGARGRAWGREAAAAARAAPSSAARRLLRARSPGRRAARPPGPAWARPPRSGRRRGLGPRGGRAFAIAGGWGCGWQWGVVSSRSRARGPSPGPRSLPCASALGSALNATTCGLRIPSLQFWNTDHAILHPYMLGSAFNQCRDFFSRSLPHTQTHICTLLKNSISRISISSTRWNQSQSQNRVFPAFPSPPSNRTRGPKTLDRKTLELPQFSMDTTDSRLRLEQPSWGKWGRCPRCWGISQGLVGHSSFRKWKSWPGPPATGGLAGWNPVSSGEWRRGRRHSMGCQIKGRQVQALIGCRSLCTTALPLLSCNGWCSKVPPGPGKVLQR